MKIRYTVLLTFLLIAAGCHHDSDDVILYDDYAPLPPVGIVSVSLDNAVDLQWIENQEADLAGYNVYVSDRFNGVYEFIGSVRTASFRDRGAINGVTNYYAVTAYDVNGNESDLSRDVVYDTPRPEGRGVRISDRFVNPGRAAYDFSSYSIVHYDTQFSDVFLETATDGTAWLVVWDDTDIQDMGFTTTIDEISAAPAEGWNPTGEALAVRGHTYIIWTKDNHYAKLRIVDIGASHVEFDWAYQVAEGNPELLVGSRKSLNKRSRIGENEK